MKVTSNNGTQCTYLNCRRKKVFDSNEWKRSICKQVLHQSFSLPPRPPTTLKVSSCEITCMVGELKKEIENLPGLLKLVHIHVHVGCMICARDYHEVTTVCNIKMLEVL